MKDPLVDEIRYQAGSMYEFLSRDPRYIDLMDQGIISEQDFDIYCLVTGALVPIVRVRQSDPEKGKDLTPYDLVGLLILEEDPDLIKSRFDLINNRIQQHLAKDN